MSIKVMCLTSNGGIPIFARSKGKSDQIPFSIVASLNGVHMYGKSQGVLFLNTKTEDNETVVWREFDNSLILIAVSTLNDEMFLDSLLKSIFSVMVFTVGNEEIRHFKNIERLKRELRACYPLIEKFMDSLDFSDKNISVDLLPYVETTLVSESSALKSFLTNFVESCPSLYCCVTVDGALSVATDEWWQLPTIERKLILYLIISNNTCTCFDIPAFLGGTNSSVRVVSIKLLENVSVTTLLGPKPDLNSLEQIAFQCWAPTMDILTNLKNPMPLTFQLHTSLLGFLLIDLKFDKYFFHMFTPLSRKDARSSNDVLRTFYYQSGYLLSIKENDCLETYWCSEYHKIHGLKQEKYLLCVLYTAAIPSYSMRSMTKNLLTLLRTDPRTVW